MYDLSVCLPSIRLENLTRLYHSIKQSVGNYTFEMSVVSPYDQPDHMKLENVTWQKDFGCPTRACQLSVINAKGKFLAWGADDGWFLGNHLEHIITTLDGTNDPKAVVVSKYIEGGREAPNEESLHVNYHDPVRSPYYDWSYLIFGMSFMSLEYFLDLGGFDCQFEVCPMAFIDLGVRATRDGARIIPYFVNVFECTHFEGTTGDHGPIHYAQIDHDQPLYGQIYNNPDCVNRTKIPLDNWKLTPDRWARRF